MLIKVKGRKSSLCFMGSGIFLCVSYPRSTVIRSLHATQVGRSCVRASASEAAGVAEGHRGVTVGGSFRDLRGSDVSSGHVSVSASGF